MFGEAHLSTGQARTQTAALFPQALGYAGRPQGSGGPPRARPQAAVGVAPTPERLRARRDFLAANKGRRAVTDGFILLARDRADGGGVRVGFTVTKKIGNSVVRNRLKRRLRALVSESMPALASPAHDYVLIGREAGLTRAYADLIADLQRAVRKVAR